MLRSAVVNVDGMITSIFELLRRVPYVSCRTFSDFLPTDGFVAVDEF